MNFQPPDNDDPRDDEQRFIDGERAAFEKDAEPMGFDLTRMSVGVPEPWSEYKDEATGHRWGGWLARARDEVDEASVRLYMAQRGLMAVPRADYLKAIAPQEASKPEVGGMNEYDLLEEWTEAAGLCFDGVGDCNTTGPVRRMDILQLIRVARDLKLPTASKEASKAVPVADEREADRVRFPDPAFNRWLDEGISDGGHTVWDAVGDVQAAWSGWTNRDFYRSPQPAETAISEELIVAHAIEHKWNMDQHYGATIFQFRLSGLIKFAHAILYLRPSQRALSDEEKGVVHTAIRDSAEVVHGPYLCIAPVCGEQCGQCTYAISPQDVRDYARRYAHLRTLQQSGCGVFEFQGNGEPNPNGILLGGHLDDFIEKEMAASSGSKG